MNTVLEGFYGQQWSWEQRRFLIQWLGSLKKLSGADKDLSFQQYCYAPKGDIYLRNSWQKPWPLVQIDEMRGLSELAQQCDVGFSVGFSPVGLFELWVEDVDAAKNALGIKCKEFALLGLSSLGLFFDDMPASDARIAAVQVDICLFIQNLMPELKIYLCPSYYSYDPVLPELFGAMPPSYWQDLGDGLPKTVELFWTGDKVISASYPESSLKAISDIFNRRLTIWDNSCVNDGRLTSNVLPFHTCASLTDIHNNCHVSSFWLNPSNAFSLTLIVILSALREGASGERMSAVLKLLPETLAAFIDVNHSLLAEVGLSSLSDAEIKRLSMELNTIEESINSYNISGLHCEVNVKYLVDAVVSDVQFWLEGGFQFAPDCLT